MTICQTFLELGDAVSRKLEIAYGSHISFGEETVTESTLLEIWHRHSAIVQIKTFSKATEAVNGADWEWRLVGRQYTLRMRVQAKRLAKNGQQFKGLFTQKPKSGSHPQIDLLIADAAAGGLLPAYCFYSVEAARGIWTAAAMPPGFLAGCMIGDARTIKAYGSKYLSSIEWVSVPWHYLVCGSPRTNSPFPTVAFLNGADGAQAVGKAEEPYVYETGGEPPRPIDVQEWREQFSLPEDYLPAPPIGRITIDCRELV